MQLHNTDIMPIVSWLRDYGSAPAALWGKRGEGENNVILCLDTSGSSLIRILTIMEVYRLILTLFMTYCFKFNVLFEVLLVFGLYK